MQKSDFISRNPTEIDLMVKRIISVRDGIPEEKGFKQILDDFISDLLNYPKEKSTYDETPAWLARKPELLEDYLLGLEGLIQFVEDVKAHGIVFEEDDLYNDDCACAKNIKSKYHIFKRGKAIYLMSFLVNNKIVLKLLDYVAIYGPGPHAHRGHRLRRALDLPAPRPRTISSGEERLGLQLDSACRLARDAGHRRGPAPAPLFPLAAGLGDRPDGLNRPDGREEDEMKGRFLKAVSGLLALLCMAVCLAAPVLYFLGHVTEGTYKTTFLVASIGWFVFAVARGSSGKSPAAPET